jgi:Cu2+-exporting ATPase
LSKKYKTASETAHNDGQSIVYVLEGETVLGAMTIADVIREESKQAVSELQEAGIRVAMLTGDSKGVAQWVSKELALDEFYAEVLPGINQTS